jgi:hypothetical protein
MGRPKHVSPPNPDAPPLDRAAPKRPPLDGSSTEAAIAACEAQAFADIAELFALVSEQRRPEIAERLLAAINAIVPLEQP